MYKVVSIVIILSVGYITYRIDKKRVLIELEIEEINNMEERIRWNS